jgi:hypothetical protein
MKTLTDAEKIVAYNKTAERQKEYDKGYYTAKAVLDEKIQEVLKKAGFDKKAEWEKAKQQVGM